MFIKIGVILLAEMLDQWQADVSDITRKNRFYSHWKRAWCWRRLKAGGEGDNREDDWMTSLTQWRWAWPSSRRCEGQESLACCSPWFCKELDTAERHSNNEVTFMFHHESMFSLSNSVTLRGSHPTIHWAMTCSKNLFLPHLPTQLLLKSLNLEEDGGKEWKMVKCVWCLGWKHAECVSCKLLLQQTHSGNNDFISSPHLSLLLSLSSSAKSGAKQENKYWVLFQLSLYLPYFNTCNKNHMPVDFNFWTRFCLYLKWTLFRKMSWKLKQDLKGFTWTSDIWLLIRDLPTREA